MKNLYIWGWHSQDQEAAISSIEKKVHIKKWIRNSSQKKELNDIIHKPQSLGFPKYTPLPRSLDNTYNESFRTFCDMYSRVAHSLSLTFNELENLYDLYFHWAHQQLENNGIDTLLFSSPPHMGPDYLLYRIANALKIETIICMQSILPNRFFYFDNLDNLGKKSSHTKQIENAIDLSTWITKPLFYMTNIQPYSKSSYGRLATHIFKATTRPSKMSLPGAYKLFALDKTYKKKIKSTNENPDLNKPYVYFPLQLQPEMTTSFLGGRYSDQLRALEATSSLIPDDWKIYVKENPKQTSMQRGRWFYDRLDRIPKVDYVSPKFSSPALINSAKFVSLITGTAGFEATLEGIPCLVFGQAWYHKLPGVKQYKQEITLEDVLNQKWSFNDSEAALNKLTEKCYPGIVDPVYISGFPDYQKETNILNLKDFLLNVVVGQ